VRRTIDAPTPVLAITTRSPADEVAAVGEVIARSLAALRETARRLELEVVGVPLRVDHGDATVVEVCLAIRSAPEIDPPAPVAAEVLTPGTIVESVDES